MDKILRGILFSDIDRKIKDQVVWKVKNAGITQAQTQQALSEMIKMTMDLMLHETDRYIVAASKDVYISWASSNCSSLAECFTPRTVWYVIQESCDAPEHIPWILFETFTILKQTQPQRLPKYFAVVEYWATDFVIRNSHFKVLNPFCSLLLSFPHCIPKGQLTRTFCVKMLSSISALNPIPDSETNPVEIIHKVNVNICGLLFHVWNYSTEDIISASLHHIFTLLSNEKAGEMKAPDMCLGGVVQGIPIRFVEPSINHLLGDSCIKDASLSVALKRLTSWLSWPGADNAANWIRSFICGLRASGKEAIVRHCIETQIDQIADLLTFPVVREGSLSILFFMLLTHQESPDPWLKVAGVLGDVLRNMKEELAEAGNNEKTHRHIGMLVELIYCMIQMHPGFPDVYENIYQTLKLFPKPAAERIESLLNSYQPTVTPQTPHNWKRSSIVPQLWTNKSETNKVGLANLGNTCYMNSVLQAIFMCESFRQAVLMKTPSPKEPLLLKLQHLFAFLTSSHRPFFYPESFYEASRPSWFEIGYQHDCSEFLRHLLDLLDSQEVAYLREFSGKNEPTNGTKKEKKEGGFHLFKSKTKESRSAPASLCGADQDQQISLVTQTFGGKLINTYQCLKCGTESKSEEKFNDIALAFPEKCVQDGKQKSPRHVEKQNPVENGELYINGMPVVEGQPQTSKLSLTDMLQSFLAPEKLTGENKYKCDQCKSLQDAERSINIAHGPEYLIFNLLRFSYDYKRNQRSKIFTDVNYPKILQVPVSVAPTSNSPVHQKSGKLEKKSHRKSQTHSGDLESSDRAAVKYETYCLCGVVVHSGLSSDAGHYYCYARHCVPNDHVSFQSNGALIPTDSNGLSDYFQDQWFLFNDARVSFSTYQSFSKVTQKFAKDTAYLLIYCKIDSIAKIDVPALLSRPLRTDLLAAVEKDNMIYRVEQENEVRRREEERSRRFTIWSWKDNEDKGPPPPSCGGGGGGSMGFSSPHFIC